MNLLWRGTVENFCTLRPWMEGNFKASINNIQAQYINDTATFRLLGGGSYGDNTIKPGDELTVEQDFSNRLTFTVTRPGRVYGTNQVLQFTQ